MQITIGPQPQQLDSGTTIHNDDPDQTISLQRMSPRGPESILLRPGHSKSLADWQRLHAWSSTFSASANRDVLATIEVSV